MEAEWFLVCCEVSVYGMCRFLDVSPSVFLSLFFDGVFPFKGMDEDAVDGGWFSLSIHGKHRYCALYILGYVEFFSNCLEHIFS